MTVTTRIAGNIAYVTVDNPPVNAASHAVRQGLLDAVGTVAGSGARLAILSCAGRTFIAGADVREFGAPPLSPDLPHVVDAIEASPIPWLAAVHGTVLGGGLEICLGCAYRIALPDTKLGLPEVKLGLIPGAGGTVRLPRLVDPVQALEMISGGRPVTAQKALEMGLIDHIAADLDQAVLAFAKGVLDSDRPERVLHRAAPDTGAEFEAAVAKTKAGAKGQNAVIAAADAVTVSLKESGKDAQTHERATFLRLKDDPQSTALRHIFFAERSVSKLPELKGVSPNPVTHVGVVGGGTMGSGIAAACLLAGLTVTMIEQSAEAAQAGEGRVAAILDGALKRGKLTKAERKTAEERFSAGTQYAALCSADLVIEAVFEDMEIKAKVFTALDDVVTPQAILASNTSYLDISALAARTEHPARVIGLHFFSPAHVMKLLEVVVPQTALPEAISTGMALGKRLGKIAVPAGVCDGFIGNRIMSAYRREADYMIVDGALSQEVDAAMRDFGFPIGVFEMQDLAGLDIAWAMRKRQAATRDPQERYVTIADQLCEMGRFGRKTGKGWYDYTDTPNGAPDPEVLQLIEAEATKAGVKRASIPPDQIMARLLGVMQAEGGALLAEQIAGSAEAVDVVMVNGYGFPRWRGGPMFMKGQEP